MNENREILLILLVCLLPPLLVFLVSGDEVLAWVVSVVDLLEHRL